MSIYEYLDVKKCYDGQNKRKHFYIKKCVILWCDIEKATLQIKPTTFEKTEKNHKKILKKLGPRNSKALYA